MRKAMKAGWVVLLLLVAKGLSAQFVYDKEMKAPDFEGVTVDGRHYRLYDSQAERVIVCFWAVDCDYCHDFLKALRRNVDLKHDYELVSFALADSPRQVCRKTRRWRLTGWHFFDEAGWDSQPFLDYDVTSTPTVVLIDKDKSIVGIAYDWDEFEELISKTNKNNDNL
jgi:thioredoxin-related protein